MFIKHIEVKQVTILKKNDYEKMLNITSLQKNANQNTKYYVIHIKITIIFKTENKCWRGCRKAGLPVHCWWEC